MSHLLPALEACYKDASVDEVVVLNTRLSVKELLNRSEIIRDAIAIIG